MKIEEAKTELIRATNAKNNFQKRWRQSNYKNMTLYEKYIESLDRETQCIKLLKRHGIKPE